MNGELGPGDAVDVVLARAYHHAALPGRAVVRLSAENIAAGDELEMATLGFLPGEPRGAVGKERKRPLGFPGWALVHDPENARLALEVMREFKQLARMAKTRPGQAREGFDAIGARLGASVPQFLPAFYEEAGRAFLEHGAPGPAASMFGKAREAESVHALPVDEQHRVDAFLEFALAGAVTTKALAQYAKDLLAHHQPAAAYVHFRQLCVQRTLGGLPPWSGMAKELHRLAKAAGLDTDAEDAAFIAEIIESPALGKAASEFWRAYRPALVQVGRQSAAARGALLNLFPASRADHAALAAAWLDLLDETGAIDAVIGDPEDVARPNGGRAAWFDKLLPYVSTWEAGCPPRALVLLRRMAPALIRDGAPIACTARYQRIDLDVAELALELGVPIAPREGHTVDLDMWAKHADEPEHGRDPVLAAAHPQLGPLLEAAVGAHVGTDAFDAASRGMQGFLAAKRAWLARAIARAEDGGLPGVEETLALVGEKVAPATFAELPDLHARFAAIDLAAALARTLRIGILDELGWPALEAAVDELGADAVLHGGPPAVVVVAGARAIAVGPRGRLAEHDLVIPPKHELHSIRFIDGAFLVLLKGEIYRLRAYWSGAPRDVFDTELSTYSVARLVERAAVLESGAWIESLAPMRAGDRALSFGTELRASDGRTSWTSEWQHGALRWREITAHGEAGRFSWPPFIEAGLDREWRVDEASYVLPAPGGVTSSPLGVADGLVGVRVRYRTEPGQPRSQARRELEMIDGARWSGTVELALAERGKPRPRGADPACVVHLPCGGAPRPVLERRDWNRSAATTFVLDPEGRVRGSRLDASDRRYARGQAGALPVAFWHALVARDEADSQRLRAITDAEARALIDAVPVQTGAPAGIAHPAPTDVTTGVLALAHPRLRRGVTGVAVLAAQLQLECDRLAAESAPARAAARADHPRHEDQTLVAALTSWIERNGWGRGPDAWDQIERAAEVLAGDRADRTVDELPWSMIDWAPLAVARWSLAFIASALGTPAEHRRAAADLLDLITAALPPTEQLRVYTVRARHRVNERKIVWRGGNAYALVGYSVLEYAPSGAFSALDDAPIARELRGAPGPTRDEIAALAAGIARGETSWAPDRVAALADATGLTPSEASFLAAGCPSPTKAQNFLSKELREAMGLRAAQAATARDSVLAVPLFQRFAVVEEAARRGGVAALFDGRAIDALAPAWNRVVGRRAAIPEELVANAGRAIAARHPPHEALALIAAPAAPQLAADGCWALDPQGDVIRAAAPEPFAGQPPLVDAPPAFDVAALLTVANYVPYLYAELPVGDALRARAADAYDRALERLASPALWLDGGVFIFYESAGRALAEELIASVGGDAISGLHEGVRGSRIPGAALVWVPNHLKLRLQPAAIDAAAAPAIQRLVDVIAPDGEAWRVLGVVRSPDIAAIAARIRATPVPAGGYEQAPLASAPELVARVAAARALSPEAAALYLQFLVLLWPTPRNLRMWNGWTAAQLAAATAELVDAELVLEAKRERAQRTHFLPGAWEVDKPPHPPRELWKQPLYTRAGAPPLGRYLALAPFHALFERAWQRVEAGDPPRYEEPSEDDR